ncbi:glycosyltransferase family 2 protein [uncultured Thomasclavelia sp.]|uniref:glycosyltransferase family 2 protein n=1 Tax=uncultured Thomasclavelia sp. TaxID=3025759 RepID=UPI00260DD566|nr:glycosyltransferase family 2 protein [uncultured Thomasclavelia sp.]
MDKLVTLIIPVYNAGENIEHCIQSILKQTVSYFEVLLINDGSTDDSLERIKEYENKYPNIFRVLSHENMGVVKTRHRGIKESKTKYIMFIDNDDFIDPNYVETMTNSIMDGDYDIVVSGYRRATLDKVMFTVPSYPDEWSKYRMTAPWARIFKRSLIVDNDVRFLETVIGEDAYFNMSAYLYTNKIKTITYVGYNWYYEENSVSNQKQKGLKKECDLLVLLNEIDKLYKDRKDELVHYFVVKFIVWYLLFSGRDATSKRFMEEYRRLFAWKKEKGYKITIPFYSNRIKSEPLINRIYISIFLILDKLHLVSVFSKLYCKG